MNIIETNWDWNGGLSRRSSTEYIALHHAEAVTCTAKQIHEWHKSNGWSGIGYHFFVRKNGEIYRGRPLWAVGAHVQGMNHCSIGICAEGDYHNRDRVMPETQKQAIKELITYLKGIYPEAKIVGHREIGDSNCPGKYYPLKEMKNYPYREQEGAMTEEEKNKLHAIDESLTHLYQIADRIAESINKIENPMIYNYIDDNMPEWAREGVKWCVDNGIIKGTADGLGLDDKDLKYCTMIMRVKNEV